MATEKYVSKVLRIMVDKSQNLYHRISLWGKAQDVEFNSGKNAQDTLGNIYGISDSLTSTSSNIAASTAAIKAINDKITGIKLGDATQADVLVGKKFSSQIGLNKIGTMANLNGSVGYGTIQDGTTFARIFLNNTGKITQGSSYVDVPCDVLKNNVSGLNSVKGVWSVSATCDQPYGTYDYNAKITINDVINGGTIFNATWGDQSSGKVGRGNFTFENETYTVYGWGQTEYGHYNPWIKIEIVNSKGTVIATGSGNVVIR